MTKDYVIEILQIINSSMSDEDKKKQLLQYHESDIADTLGQLTKEQRLKLYRLLGINVTSEIFSYVDDVSTYIEELPKDNVADIIEQMDADDAVDVLEQLDEEERSNIVSLMEKETVDEINLITKYSDEQLGSKMTNNYIVISANNTIKEAMKNVIAQAADNDNVSVIYVEDEEKHFYGAIDLSELIVARENDDLKNIVKKNYPYFYATDLVSETLQKLKDYSLDSYPLLNSLQQIIGVVTSDDIVEAVEEEMGEDYAKLAGLSAEEDVNEPVIGSVKKRMPWLIILLFLGLVQSTFMSGFERVIAALPAVVFFQTMVLSMAGNVGTQSLAVTIRVLSQETLNKKSLVKISLKELLIGFLNGLLLSSLSFIVVYLLLLIKQQPIESAVYDNGEALLASAIVAISLLLSMTVCSLAGCLIPILFVKIKVDPAVASGPFITTINDIISVLVYYGLAWLLFLYL